MARPPGQERPLPTPPEPLSLGEAMKAMKDAIEREGGRAMTPFYAVHRSGTWKCTGIQWKLFEEFLRSELKR